MENFAKAPLSNAGGAFSSFWKPLEISVIKIHSMTFVQTAQKYR